METLSKARETQQIEIYTAGVVETKNFLRMDIQSALRSCPPIFYIAKWGEDGINDYFQELRCSLFQAEKMFPSLKGELERATNFDISNRKISN